MKKILVAVVTVAMMLTLMVPAFAEIWVGTNEIIPELIKVPETTSKPVIDGVLEEKIWGEKFIHAEGAGRAETEGFVHPTDGSFFDSAAYYNTTDVYFRWDKEYLYIGVVYSGAYNSIVDASALWSAETDCVQMYIGLDDGDGDAYNDPHMGWGVNGNQDATEAYANVFEQSMPDAADSATCTEGIQVAVGVDGLYTTYEMAIPLADCLGSEGALNDEYLISICPIDEGTYYYQIGQGVLWAGKTPTNCPMLVFSEALPVEEEPAEEPEVEVEEPAEEPEVEVEEPAEEPEVEVEEEPEVEETPAPSNPSTADVSVLFYALAAISAIGGISVFKRK